MKPRRCTVRIFDKKGFCSELKLDSSKYDNIGFTQESLDAYMRKFILMEKGRWYYVTKDNYSKIPTNKLKEEIKKLREELDSLIFLDHRGNIWKWNRHKHWWEIQSK